MIKDQIKDQIKALSDSCFDVEAQLPLFNTFGGNTPAQELRRELYRVRVALGSLTRAAQWVDEQNG